jgi:hypothetical protein
MVWKSCEVLTWETPYWDLIGCLDSTMQTFKGVIFYDMFGSEA